MSFKIQGLDKLQKQLEEASKAFEALDGEITTIQFSPSDQASVEAAISDMERAIDGRVAQFSGNPFVDQVSAKLKAKYQEQILERAMIAKGQELTGKTNAEVPQQSLFRQIENTVMDLRRSGHNTFDRHIKNLARLLHSPSLESLNRELSENVDLDAWLQAGSASRGGMVGSAKLPWPDEPKKQLGLVLRLVDRFAENPEEATHFSLTFYYSGARIDNNIQSMVAQVIVPFARDYIDYVKAATGATEGALLPLSTEPAARKAFVVHGHDEGAREAVARFLERIGFEAIILHEQPSQGRTVIEKIEANGDVGFAVVLLSPDDEGSVKGGVPQPRARQNVLLELGYFIGRLGRSRVCALKRGEVEIPSDFAGVVYETFDSSNGWKEVLGRELQAAGFEIDWNRILKP